MKKSIFISMLLTLMVPFFSFSAVSVGAGISIFTGPNSSIYVHARSFPSSGSWENVGLDGILAGANGDYLLVRTPEGVQHYVYLTDRTSINGTLNYGAHVTIQGRLMNGTFYAISIGLLSPENAEITTPPPTYVYQTPPPAVYPYPPPYPYPYVYPYPDVYWYPDVFIRFGGGWHRGWGWGHHWR